MPAAGSARARVTARSTFADIGALDHVTIVTRDQRRTSIRAPVAAAAAPDRVPLGPVGRTVARGLRGRAGGGRLPGRAAGPDPAHGAALFRRARRAGHRRRRAGDARGVLAPARTGGQALRGWPDRDHRRAGSPRGARPGGGRRHPGEARPGHGAGAAARTHRRDPSTRSPAPIDEMPLETPDPENEEQWVSDRARSEPARDLRAAGDRHRQAGRAHRALRPLPDASTSSRSRERSGFDGDAGSAATSRRRHAAAARGSEQRPTRSASRSRCRSIPAAPLPRACVSACTCTAPRASGSSAPTAKPSARRATRISACSARSPASRRCARRWSRAARRCRRPRPASKSARARRSTCSLARRQLFEAQTNYSRSRYDYILNVLQLQLATGTLDRADLDEINSFLRERVITR